jgi:hypothetical protein
MPCNSIAWWRTEVCVWVARKVWRTTSLAFVGAGCFNLLMFYMRVASACVCTPNCRLHVLHKRI